MLVRAFDEVLPSDPHLHLVTLDGPAQSSKIASLGRWLTEEGARDVTAFGGGLMDRASRPG